MYYQYDFLRIPFVEQKVSGKLRMITNDVVFVDKVCLPVRYGWSDHGRILWNIHSLNSMSEFCIERRKMFGVCKATGGDISQGFDVYKELMMPLLRRF